MQFPCPSCRATISANPPRPGRFTPKCPKCGAAFVVSVRVSAVGDPEPEGKARPTPPTHDPDQTAPTVPARRPISAAADPDATFTSDANRPPADPDATFASAPAAGDRTQATGGATPRRDDADQTAVQQAGESSRDPAADDELSEQFGGYEVLKRLGRGGMGAVYLARQLSLDRAVALKVMNPKWADDPVFLARFIREAYAAAQLTHHNVVQIYELGRAAETNYFSMEFVDGKSLGDLNRKAGRVAPDEAVGYALQAAKGLKFAHDRGMVHRDIKPDNLMVNSEGVVKVADLGLVKTRAMSAADDHAAAGGAAGAGGSGLRELSDITRVGSAMGSPSYMAPEQCRDAAAVDGRADIYSLGCTLFALLAGRAPFQATTAAELISKHLTEPPPPVRQFAADVPADLAAIVQRTLAKDPAERYASMDEFIGALKYWQQERANGPPRPTEVQLAAFEVLARRLGSAPTAKAARLVGTFGPPLGVVAALVALVFSPVAAGAVALGVAAAVLAGFVASGLLTGAFVFRKVREWAFGARVADWLTVGVAVLLFAAGLYFAGLHLVGLVAVAVGALVGVGYAYGLAKPARDHELDTKDEVEKITKRLRLAGLDEDAVRLFVVETAGDRWERVFEALYGYPAKVQARQLYADKVAHRPKHAEWRDPLVRKLDAILDARRQARAKKLVQQAEAERLKSEGLSAAEAADRAADAADDLVEQGKQIQAANADGKMTVNVGEMMTKYEKAKLQPPRPRPSPVARLFRKLVAVPFDPRLRLLLGAALVVGGLMWFKQNAGASIEAATTGATGVQSTAEATAKAKGAWQVLQPLILTPEKATPMQIGWLPDVVTGFFDSANPLVAGLLLLLSSLSSRWGAILTVAVGAAVAFAGHKFGVPIPDLGPLKSSHLTGIVGVLLGAVGFVLLGRK